MDENDENWLKTDWKHDQLQDKRVQFELSCPGNKTFGLGVFRITQSPSGELQIKIVVTTALSSGGYADDIYSLSQITANKIKKHPDQSVAEFLLMA